MSGLLDPSSRLASRLVVTAVVLVMTPLLGAGTCDSVCTGKRIVRVLYPEVGERAWVATVRGESNMAVDGPLTVFAMDISKPPVSEGFPNTPGAGSPQRESDLTIHFEFFDEIGGPGLFQMMTIGPLANHDKLESLRRSVDDHPTWSDTQVIETMESSGARFGPDKKGALIAQLHLDRLGAILGPIHVHSAEFNLRNEAARQNNLESAELVWRVQISAGTQRRKLDYVLMAEPFDGKVIGIVRLPAHGKK